PFVVGVQEGQVGSGRFRDAAVPGRSGTSVLLSQEADARVAVSHHQVAAGVRGAVVHDDDLVVGERLGAYRVEGSPNVRGLVVERDDNRYLHVRTAGSKARNRGVPSATPRGLLSGA